MERSIKNPILKDLFHKIVLISGPRQCGKTTLAKQLSDTYDYFNYDLVEDRLALLKKTWDRSKPLIIFDELHKMKNWKRWLKGIYDTAGIPPQLVVTGSAKLDAYRKMGDSLAGRHFQYRLHPIDLKEAKTYLKLDENEIFDTLWHCGGFPEPFFKGDKVYYRRWQRSHLDSILRQDLTDMYTIKDIAAIETLVHLLKDRVGSSVVYASLARDLERDINTIKRWLLMLENMYIIFRVTPYHKNIARALLKEPKFYFYDHTYAHNDDGAHLENIVAGALLKELDYIEDTTGTHTALHYLRTKDSKELDFLICFDGKPVFVIEVKTSEGEPSSAFNHFLTYFPKTITAIQLVKNLPREKTYPNGVQVRSLISWLAKINLLPQK